MEQLIKAIEFSARAHRNQLRKRTDIPYITHPFAVALLLQEANCSKQVVIAGLLHDTIEDTSITLEDIKREFGDPIAHIVEACSEPDKSQPWELRKQHTIDHLKELSAEAKMVMCADKFHNLMTIALEKKSVGDKVWAKFNRGYESQKWYYHSVLSALMADESLFEDNPLCSRFKRLVYEMFGEPEK